MASLRGNPTCSSSSIFQICSFSPVRTGWRPVSKAPREEIEQVIQNFLSNAVKYTPVQGAIVVQIRKVQLVIEEGQLPSDFLMLSVFNSGSGIPKQEIPLIFDRYRNVTAGKENKQQTTGLGLIICQRIIEAHNGKIWVESEQGKGATFFFALPIR